MPSFSRLHMYLSAGSTQVPGESPDAGFLNQIQLTSISWDIGRGKDKAGGSNRGTVEPGLFEFSKPMDKASTAMLMHMKSGEELAARIVLASHPDQTNPESSDYTLMFELTNARIVEYKVDASDGDKSGEIKEDWTFTYSELKVKYKPPHHDTLESQHHRVVETTSKSELEAILAKFAALKTPQQIDVKPDLLKLYSRFE